MADDLAAVGPARSHRGLEAFFLETLRRSDLGFDISAVKPAEEWLATVQEAAQVPEVADVVITIVRGDPLALPVTAALEARARSSVVPLDLRERVQTLPERLTFGEWATQVLRERQLVRWLAGKGN